MCVLLGILKNMGDLYYVPLPWYMTSKKLTVLIEYIDLFYKMLFHKLGFIVYCFTYLQNMGIEE